jgi:hypothetical protein
MLVLAALLADASANAPAVELRYHGSFAKVGRNRDAAGEPVKRFDLYCLSTRRDDRGRDVTFLIEEHGGGAARWFARFGTIAVDPQNRSNPANLRLSHEHERTQYVLPVPFPYFEFADRLSAGAAWEAPRTVEAPTQRDTAPWKYRVAGTARVGSHECWRVNVTNNFGPQESLWIEKGSPLLVQAERRIVIGRGEAYVLKIGLDSVTPMAEDRLARLQRPLDRLLRLQEELHPDTEKGNELSESQLKKSTAALKDLEEPSQGTPFEPLVASIARDVNAQSRRSGDLESLSKRFVGKAVPAVQFKSIDGEAVDLAAKSGKVMLLHFWSYRGEPFPSEPYGQIGFLDFLYNRRKVQGLEVYGIAVDKGTAAAGENSAILRSIRKLQSFMNLSYPLVLDDGVLLDKFGDPERVGAKLPLWVLIGPTGNVVEYKVGTYDVKGNEGLRHLDRTIVGLLKSRPQPPAKP